VVDGNAYSEIGPVVSVAIFGLAEDSEERSKALRVRQIKRRPVFDALLARGDSGSQGKLASTMCDTSILSPKIRDQRDVSDAEALRVAIDQPMPGVRVIRVAGELDMLTAPQLDSCLLSQIDVHGRHVVVDLSKVTFLAATGLGSLVRAREAATCHHIKLYLTGADHRAVAHPLKITGLCPTFTIHPSTEAVIARVAAQSS
jgi:anti-sigma B factor antagonist